MRSRSVLTVLFTALVAAVLAACSTTSGGSGGGSDLQAVKSAGVLRVATEGTYSPFSFHDPKTNALTGYDVEVAKAVADKLGVKVEYVETPWDAIFAGLAADRYDVVVNQVTKNPERAGLYGLSSTYTWSEGVIATRATDSSVTSLAALKGKKSAQSLTSNWAKVAKDAGAQVESVEGFTQAITLLKQSRVDATVNDSLAVLDYQKSTGDQTVKISGKTGDVSEQVVATRKGSDLVAAVDKALGDLKADGTLKKLSEKYFGSDVTVKPTA
ncbi:amino acid ABC transporter substrate-binding protein [Terrabacter sp. 2YAF2]|uniref:amino acid ABC transporter substrate-binding protein n=1 Tax=Terrabacter sp. 2YAF2 TaxID=3233026 RepID=UPI003F96FAA1